MQYLTVGDTLRLHQIATGTDPDADLIVDFGLLESAITRPQQSVGGQDAYPDVHDKAAALMHSLCRNHPFVDGNKRTAVMAAGVFYGLNGWELIVEEGELVGLTVDVGEGLLDVPAIAGRMKNWVRAADLPDPDPEDEYLS